MGGPKNSRSKIVHTSGATCFKTLKTAKKTIWGVLKKSRSKIVHTSGTTCLKSSKSTKKNSLGGVLNKSRSKIVHTSGTTCLKSPKAANKLVQGPQQITIEHCPRLSSAGQQSLKSAIEDCSRFWDHTLIQNRRTTGPGSLTNHDRNLFTLLAGRKQSSEFAIEDCSHFWDHMLIITQNRK